MKIVFLGTPIFAKNILSDLLEKADFEVVGVVTQPDKPVGRSKKPVQSPVAEYASLKGIPVYKFKKITDASSTKQLKVLGADIFVTAAYGQILSSEVLNIAPMGVYNVHASILPKYRGAAPVQWAIIKGEKTSGISIMKTNLGIDSGDILLTQEVEISSQDTSRDLFDKLSLIAGKTLIKALKLLKEGNFKLTPQKESLVTFAPMLNKKMAKINFSLPAEQIVNLIRGLNPWPVAYTHLNKELLKVYRASVFEVGVSEIKNFSHLKAGEVAISSPKIGLVVKTKDGLIRLEEIQLFGKKTVSDKAFLNGKKVSVGTFLGE